MFEAMSTGEMAGYGAAGVFLIFLAYKFFSTKKSGGSSGGGGGTSNGNKPKKH